MENMEVEHKLTEQELKMKKSVKKQKFRASAIFSRYFERLFNWKNDKTIYKDLYEKARGGYDNSTDCNSGVINLGLCLVAQEFIVKKIALHYEVTKKFNAHSYKV